MKLYTENEIFRYNTLQTHKLAKLYKSDKELFLQMADFLDVSIHVNKRISLDMVYVSENLSDYFEEDTHDIYKHGFSLIKKYLDEKHLQHSLNTIHTFEQSFELDKVCNYTQLVKTKGRWVFLMTQKLFLDNEHYFNTNLSLKDFGKPGMIMHDLLDEYLIKRNGLLRYQSLTKREKEILHLLTQGFSNKQIAERLSVSVFTVQTHRKIINQKLDTNSLAELTKFTMAFDML